jgi:sodium/potassium/calcium exchanger 6
MPTKFPLEDQCAHVKEECPGSDSFLSIPYVEQYFCAKPEVRPWTFAGLVIWLVFLFSTIGISASDFFCPNLATVADTLGLDENVAGVTFLAFGNGSPDVFSTFSAMRSNTGSLAVGELFGAASFIVTCVVGSMCIIRPFKVEKFPFLRDVGFFFIAVSLVIVVLWDGRLILLEALLLVGLYFTYVCVVIIGSWWERRQEARRAHEALIRDEYSVEGIPEITYHDEEPYRDDPDDYESKSVINVRCVIWH